MVPVHLADVTYPEFHPLAGEDGIVLAFAIRHPEGLVLVDTGIGEGDAWVDEHYRPRVRDIGEALRGAAVEPEDVRTIVHTHLHFDHCGQDHAFPGVPIVVQRAEREAADVAGHTVPGLVGFPGARYELVDGDSEIAPGVSVLATPDISPSWSGPTTASCSSSDRRRRTRARSRPAKRTRASNACAHSRPNGSISRTTARCCAAARRSREPSGSGRARTRRR